MEAETPAVAANVELFKALIEFQGKFTNPKKDSENPYFNSKYADLSGIWECVRPTLTQCGLAFIQMPTSAAGVVSITGRLIHSSGQFIESEISLAAKDSSPQAIGSAITYGRRYQLTSMLGIAPADDDDDGNTAQKGHDAKKAQDQTAKPAAPAKPPAAAAKSPAGPEAPAAENPPTGEILDVVAATAATELSNATVAGAVAEARNMKTKPDATNKTGNPYTIYTLVQGEKTMKIAVWGSPSSTVLAGMEVLFDGVKSKVSNGVTQYSANHVEVAKL